MGSNGQPGTEKCSLPVHFRWGQSWSQTDDRIRFSVSRNPCTPIFLLFDPSEWNFCLAVQTLSHRKLSTVITSGGVDQFLRTDFPHGEHHKSFRMRPPRASGDDLSGTFARERVLLYHHFGIRVILGRASRPARVPATSAACK